MSNNNFANFIKVTFMSEFLVKFFSIKNVLWHFNLGNGYDLSYIEAVGTIFGLLCIWYASLEKRINFYFGLVNVILFAIIFYQIQLYANLLLQVFFFVMNTYGLYVWGKVSDNDSNLNIRWLSKQMLIITTFLSIIFISLLALYVNQFFNLLTMVSVKLMQVLMPNLITPALQADPYPFMDAAITVLSVVAMVQMTRKLVENWLLWVLIDVMSIILYTKQGVYFMALEYVVLTFIALNGSVMWIKAARKS